MKKIFIVLVLLAASFYAAWPAYSLYQIANGVQTRDETKLESKVSWPDLRESLRAPVTERVTKEINNQSKGRGIEGVLAGQVAGEFTPKLVEKILDTYVTPKGVITLANQGGRIDTANLGIGGLLQHLNANNDQSANPGEKKDLIGGLLGKAKDIVNSVPGGKELVTSTLSKYGQDLTTNLDKQSTSNQSGNDGSRTKYGLDNIKSFNFNGPFSFEVGLAKSPTAKKPDLIAGMSFVDMDWKLSKLVPTL